VPLPRLPLTPNGKIDRKGLPKPQGNTHAGEEAAGKNDVELQVIKLWAAVLGSDCSRCVQ